MLVADYGKNAVRIDDFNVFAERTWGAIVWDPYPANLQTLAAGKCWKLIPRGAFLKCNMKEPEQPASSARVMGVPMR